MRIRLLSSALRPCMHDHRRRAHARWALSFEYYNHEVPIYLSDSNNTDARASRAITMMITTSVEAAQSKLLNIELRCTGLHSRLRLLLLKNLMESSPH